MVGKTQGGGQGSMVRRKGRAVLRIGIPEEDHGEHALYQNLFTVGDLLLTRSTLASKYVLFTKKRAHYFMKTSYFTRFSWIRHKTGSEKCVNRPL